jgi:hypothetical protein
MAHKVSDRMGSSWFFELVPSKRTTWFVGKARGWGDVRELTSGIGVTFASSRLGLE